MQLAYRIEIIIKFTLVDTRRWNEMFQWTAAACEWAVLINSAQHKRTERDFILIRQWNVTHQIWTTCFYPWRERWEIECWTRTITTLTHASALTPIRSDLIWFIELAKCALTIKLTSPFLLFFTSTRLERERWEGNMSTQHRNDTYNTRRFLMEWKIFIQWLFRSGARSGVRTFVFSSALRIK
jgi:hypothetical protein